MGNQILFECLNLAMLSSDDTISKIFSEPTEIDTSVGTVIPQYYVEDHGRMQHKSVVFYRNGQVKKMPLQKKTYVDTPCGTFPAELLMFYENGALKKLFPLNGKLSGYWNEKNEYSLAEDLTISLPTGDITAKIINIGFYPSGNIRSITFWPEERVLIKWGTGLIKVRTGMAFYENGSLRSLEPALPETIATPIGNLKAFDNDPEGISGDINSVKFNINGEIYALCTVSDSITVKKDFHVIAKYEPSEKASLCSDLVKITIPLLVEFIDGKVRFNNSKHDEYELSGYSFSVENYSKKTFSPSFDCG